VINDQRKERDFDIADRIVVRMVTRGRVEAAAHRHRDWIARETLAVGFEVEGDALLDDTDATTVIDGEPVRLEIRRA